jgi:2-polyprenyl-6-hydroxyphenyl methylase/3-demethylubiquinone-9 3-methyltransferase
MPTDDLRQLENHFAFGRNWQSFAHSVTEDNIAQAVSGLQRLFAPNQIEGCRFLDIGSGAGLSMLAALRMGARSVTGVDIDPNSVEAARTLLSLHAPDEPWKVELSSVFDLTPEEHGTFDIVYSWGVLHHTGDMWLALRKAAALVSPGGQLAIALYRRTPLCGFWQWEKRLYSTSNRLTQAIIRLTYETIYCAGVVTTGRNPIRYVRGYKSQRGMNWFNDVHDWLGGYPYQSSQPEEVVRFLKELGFAVRLALEKPAALRGLLGSHCDEFVAVRQK